MDMYDILLARYLARVDVCATMDMYDILLARYLCGITEEEKYKTITGGDN